MYVVITSSLVVPVVVSLQAILLQIQELLLDMKALFFHSSWRSISYIPHVCTLLESHFPLLRLQRSIAFLPLWPGSSYWLHPTIQWQVLQTKAGSCDVWNEAESHCQWWKSRTAEQWLLDELKALSFVVFEVIKKLDDFELWNPWWNYKIVPCEQIF